MIPLDHKYLNQWIIDLKVVFFNMLKIIIFNVF